MLRIIIIIHSRQLLCSAAIRRRRSEVGIGKFRVVINVEIVCGMER